MTSGSPDRRFQPGFELMEGGWDNIHQEFPTLMSIAFGPAKRIQPISLRDEDAFISKRDSSEWR
jgi:hypothetical protein